jgi:Fic family protein
MQPFVIEKLPPPEIDWVPLIPLIGQANRKLAEYEGVLYGSPNSDVLISPLTRREAVLSSKIEGTQATVGEVLKFEAGEAPEQESRREDIYEIMNYRQALREAERELQERPFNLNLLLKLHSTLLDSVRGRNKGKGKFRTEQNWIGAPGSSIEQAEFIPPAPGDTLMQGLYDWESFYHADCPDPLVQLAIVHAQFEILHPFLDGNGRLGRILIPLFLSEKKILSRPVFYLSEYLEREREAYIASLRAIGSATLAWNSWVQFFLNGLIQQAQANILKTRQIYGLYNHLKSEVIRLTRSQFAIPLLDAIFLQPIFQPSRLEGAPNLPSRPMIMNMVGKLKDAGMLAVLREGRGPHPQTLMLADLVSLTEAG